MSTHIAWQGDDSELPTHAAAMFALPGVGNVGKLVLDSMLDALPSKRLIQFHHPDMPPHATMQDGLLQPPHIYLDSIELPDSRRILTIGGDVQPLIPRGQYEMAETILHLLQQAGTPKLYILAGLACEAGSQAVHVIAADHSTRSWLEGQGIPVSVDQPAGGVIGLCGLLASLGPSPTDPNPDSPHSKQALRFILEPNSHPWWGYHCRYKTYI